MTTPSPDELGYAPVRLRFDLEDAEQRGDVTVIRRARERISGKHVGIERPLPALQHESESSAAFAALEDSRSQLRHPHILEHYDVARDDESPYSVVEWAAGGTLAERLVKRGPLGEHELLKVANSVATALEHAATRRIHHGGVVPENLCLTADGSVKVAGFGFEKLRAASRSGRPGAAPDTAIDLFDLCRTLYRLGTAAERVERDRLARLPAWLRELLTQGLADDPTRRFRGAREFLDSLERLRDLANRGQLPSSSANYDATIEVAPDPAAEPKTASGSKRGSDSKRGSGSKGGASGKRGSPDEFPWRPLDEQYEIDGEPKQGGMGAVFRARELATGRFVAVKRMKPEAAIDQDAWRRFHREASSIANLNHPHVLQLMQAGRDDDGDYIVLEWASRGSLIDHLREHGPLAVPELVTLAKKVGSALAYAHAKGCIHRDVKPHNILISDTGEPKIADFGLARTLGDETLTTAGGGAGSLHYMAPEQSEDARHADERSDLYAFARTLYHAATGKKPIGIDPESIPLPIRKPLLKAMNEKPVDRYPTIDEFLADLERCALSVHKPVFGRWVAALVVLGGIGAGAKYWLDQRAPKPQSEPVVIAPPQVPTRTDPPRQDPPLQDPPRQDPPLQDPPPVATPIDRNEPAPVAGTGEPNPVDTPTVEEKPVAEKSVDEKSVDEKPVDAPTPPPPTAEELAHLAETLDAAAAWDQAWRDITTDSGEGARALEDNDSRRDGLAALDAARSAQRSGDVATATARAEDAVHALRRGYSLATIAWLRDAIETLLAPADATPDAADRLEIYLAELRGYVPEFFAPPDLQELAQRTNTRLKELAAANVAPSATDPPSESEKSGPEKSESPPPSPEPAVAAKPPLDPADPWSIAGATIARAPAYHGLVVAPDPSLLPLRVDPDSGLHEFLVKGTGEAPRIAGDSYAIDASTGIVLVLVPGGAVRMGSSPVAVPSAADPPRHIDPESNKNEQPEHTVELAPYFIAKYELTAAQWARITGASEVSASTPATGMTWSAAVTALGKLGLTLATEAQWEHACRAGTVTPWPTGATLDSTIESAHLRFPKAIAGRPLDRLLPVGSLTPNAFGLHDLLGNVAEYCLDHWPGDHSRATHRGVDGLRTEATSPFRVLRGACFKDHPKRARSAARDSVPADDIASKNSVIGIRAAKALLPK